MHSITLFGNRIDNQLKYQVDNNAGNTSPCVFYSKVEKCPDCLTTCTFDP